MDGGIGLRSGNFIPVTLTSLGSPSSEASQKDGWVGVSKQFCNLVGGFLRSRSSAARLLSARHRHGEGKRHSVSFKGTDSTPDFKKYPQHRLCLSSVIAMTAECLREVSCPRTFQQPGMPDHFFNLDTNALSWDKLAKSVDSWCLCVNIRNART